MGLHRRRVWEVATGFRGRAKNCIKIARQQAEKALQHAYKGRKDKKREFKSLWIQRINAGAREHGIKYSWFINGLREENVQLNRKMLSELAMFEPHSFKALVEQVQYMRGLSSSSSSGSGQAAAAPALLSSRISIGSLPPEQQARGSSSSSGSSGGGSSSSGSSSSGSSSSSSSSSGSSSSGSSSSGGHGNASRSSSSSSSSSSSVVSSS